MAMTENTQENSAPNAPEKARSISSLEDARLLLMMKNGLPIPASDPVMMLVTLLLGFADDYERMLARHNKAVTAAMKIAVTSAREDLGGEIERFSEQLRAATLENVTLLIRQHQETMSVHQHSIRQLTRQCIGISALLTAVTIGVLLWKVLA